MNPLDYLANSAIWAFAWLLVGYLLGLVQANLRDLWRDK